MLYQVGNGGASSPTDINQYYNLLTGTSTDQQVTVSQRIRAQLSGAGSASGYVGGTTGGPPTSGTFAVGDLVIDQQGATWVCTAAGTPGTWAATGEHLITSATITGTTTFSSLPQYYSHLRVRLAHFHTTASVQYVFGSLTLNGDNSSGHYNYQYETWTSGSSPVNNNAVFSSGANYVSAAFVYTGASPFTGAGGFADILISDYAASTQKSGIITSYASDGGGSGESETCFWAYNQANAITSIAVGTGGQTITGGKVWIYGVP